LCHEHEEKIMATDFYKYTSDSNDEYKYLINTVIAEAAAWELATGAEPTLPSSIGPRYGVGVNRTPLSSRIPIPFPTIAASSMADGSTVYINGVPYVIESLVGESAGLDPFAGTIGPEGPEGPEGPPADLEDMASAPAADVALSTANLGFTICTLTLGAGTWLILGRVQVQTGAAAARTTAQIVFADSSLDVSAVHYLATASQYAVVPISTIVTVAAGTVVTLQAFSSVTSSTVRRFEPVSGFRPVTDLRAVKIA
jgi:hypothetical protein